MSDGTLRCLAILLALRQRPVPALVSIDVPVRLGDDPAELAQCPERSDLLEYCPFRCPGAELLGQL